MTIQRPNAAETQLAAAGLCLATLGAAGLGAATGVELSSSDGLACPFRLVTGLPCPFCGLTRSVVALGQGRWEEAVSLSPLGPFALLTAVLVLARLMWCRLRLRATAWPRCAPWVAGSVVAGCWPIALA